MTNLLQISSGSCIKFYFTNDGKFLLFHLLFSAPQLLKTTHLIAIAPKNLAHPD